jgi:hypothetical protein
MNYYEQAKENFTKAIEFFNESCDERNIFNDKLTINRLMLKKKNMVCFNYKLYKKFIFNYKIKGKHNL